MQFAKHIRFGHPCKLTLIERSFIARQFVANEQFDAFADFRVPSGTHSGIPRGVSRELQSSSIGFLPLRLKSRLQASYEAFGAVKE